MAEKNTYPQIPSTVWWGVRGILQRTPSATVDERFLAVQLGVQDAAAKQYIVELKRVGLLTEEGRATDVAQRWRLDDSYLEAADSILAAAYPESLLQVAPPGEADRQKVISWFQREGLGSGAAGNKAATYMLIGSRDPNEAPPRGGGGKSNGDGGRRQAAAPRATKVPNPPAARSPTRQVVAEEKETSKVQHRVESIPLNVNVQIHISADAQPEQIETIFSAMRRYLYDDQSR